MKPKKYPYSGKRKKQERLAGVKTPALVIFPNVSFRKELLKHIYTVTKNHDNSTTIYFRIPKVFGAYEEQKAKVNLSYEKTIKMLNSY
ncbi:hypothetical protein [uncultured Streptococcus sp.]|uniref:hypothetical protein n=1 Tax=uncultured Streptococcus sp. TaxID=83427 RepID=UPI00204CE058|nr:hypothetical protein [uncultured Streptococcus sp.]DAP59707.1 MAG TPA: hypothetical protein [Caudoviricetes sp.]